MKLIPILAKRFLLSKSSDGFLSFIAWVSVLGVALGVVALTLVINVINGFEGELKRIITGMNGDVLLYSRGHPIQHPDEVIAKIFQVTPHVEAITASLVTELMVAGPSSVTGAFLQGIQLNQFKKVTTLPQHLIAGRFPAENSLTEITLGSVLAEKIGAEIGTDIRLVIPHSDLTHAVPHLQPVRVVGLIRMGLYEYDSKFIFMPLESVQKLLHQHHWITHLNMKLTPGSSSQSVANQLSEVFEYPFRAKDWSQFNQNLFYAIQLEKIVITILLTAIILVASFNVVSTLMMMIHDKTKEITILKVMGLRTPQVFRLFCWIGLGIGIVGILLGVLCGLGLSWLLEKTHWIVLPSDIYYIGFLPVMICWKELLVIAGFSFLITFFATLYPAWKIAHRPHSEGLRYE